MFKVMGGRTFRSEELRKRSTNWCYDHDDIREFNLDNYVEFTDGYKKSIKVRGSWGSAVYQCGGYESAARARNAEYENFIEIDIDRTRLKRGDYYFENDVIKIIPEEVVVRRKMESVASANPTD